jgi:hypothetical protein
METGYCIITSILRNNCSDTPVFIRRLLSFDFQELDVFGQMGLSSQG